MSSMIYKMSPQMLLSVVIPARNEFPNIIHTIYSICHALESDGFTHKDFEIIVVNNCSDDWKYPQRATGGTTDYLMPRGMYHNGTLRVLHDPIAGNHKATNKAARIARGKYIFRSDAHMAYKPGFFKQWLETIEKTDGLVHTGIEWMGSYPSTLRTLGIGYTIKLGEEFKGTWNNYELTGGKDWFYIPGQGHAGLGMRRDLFLQIGGYNNLIRAYGGGEVYLDWKCWMFGIPVIAEPRCVSFHLAAGRGYSYLHDDYIHNVFLAGLALGADEWIERAKLNWMRRHRKEVVQHLWDLALVECQEDRRFISKKRKMTFNDMIVNRPWEQMNKAKGLNGSANILIYHDSWLQLLENDLEVKKMYEESPLQKKLAELINTKLSEFVYKRGAIAETQNIF